jgi:hypothetical protein
MIPDDRPSLRRRLLALRSSLHQRLARADIIEPTWLAIFADTETGLAALEALPRNARGGQDEGVAYHTRVEAGGGWPLITRSMAGNVR